MNNAVKAILFLAFFAGPANSAEVSKQSWISGMRTLLPNYFCKDGSYFRECFEVAKSECLDVATKETAVCLEKTADQIPDVLLQPGDGAKWGATVGGCTGKAYEIRLLSLRISSKRCNNLDNWR